MEKIAQIQAMLQDSSLDGWLLYDFQKKNPLAWRVLQIPVNTHATRRFFYWIPRTGDPVKVIHKIEPHLLTHLPGRICNYERWQELEACLHSLLGKQKTIAMEYSPQCAVPYISMVDAGTFEMVAKIGVKIESSATLLIQCTSQMDDFQLETHYEAAKVLDQIAQNTWGKIRLALQHGQTLTEWDVQQFMAQEIQQRGYIADHPPICAVGPHTANPHYAPSKLGSLPVTKNQIVMIDLWCKKNISRSIYADITRMGYTGNHPPEEYTKVFQIVREAQKKGVSLLMDRAGSGKPIYGYEVDGICREHIEKEGYGPFFIHRTGHNIYEDLHGFGAHFDGFETFDNRPLLPNTCYSVEPGIYIEWKFGVRLELDVVFHQNRTFEITGGEQDELVLIH